MVEAGNAFQTCDPGVVARFLIIDDDNALRAWMAMTLQRAGHGTVEAATGFEALERIRQQPVDVVITDVLLPDNGIEGVMALRNEFPLVPFIVVTGLVVESSSALEAQSLLRARRILAKPFAMAELVAVSAEVAAEAAGRD